MADPVSSGGDKLRARWQALFCQTPKWYLLWVPVGGVLMFVAGIVFWGGFNTVLEATNTEAFCTSCHEMRDFVFVEYKETIHYRNRTGVRATCPDCHVPKQWGYKMIRKIQASNELWHKMLGTISTQEKFEAHRAELAQNVWDTMKATNSRECRNCHSVVFMNPEKQRPMAQKIHQSPAVQGGQMTCIDCHKGIAHHLPKEPEKKS